MFNFRETAKCAILISWISSISSTVRWPGRIRYYRAYSTYRIIDFLRLPYPPPYINRTFLFSHIRDGLIADTTVPNPSPTTFFSLIQFIRLPPPPFIPYPSYSPLLHTRSSGTNRASATAARCPADEWTRPPDRPEWRWSLIVCLGDFCSLNWAIRETIVTIFTNIYRNYWKHCKKKKLNW